LIIWKDSFERVNAELDRTKRKKQALDGLYNGGRISQFAYECLNKDLTEEIEETEARRKALAEKMTSKINELEEQRIALEMFLANNEMAYAVGEIDDELHGKEGNALDLGLEATRQELLWIKEVIIQLIPKDNEPLQIPESAETAEAAESNGPVEKPAEATPGQANVPVEVPVEVTEATSEVKVEQIQQPAETPPKA
jgi:hypothetical protein